MMPKLPLAFGVWQTDVVLFIDFGTPFLNPISLSYDQQPNLSQSIFTSYYGS